MQTVRQLHQHHTNITGHRQKHLAQILGLGLRAVGEMKATQLGDAFHQLTHFRPEMAFELIWCHIGVFHHIVEKTRSNHAGTCTDVPQQVCHGHRMHDVRVTTGPELPLMQLKRKIESSR